MKFYLIVLAVLMSVSASAFAEEFAGSDESTDAGVVAPGCLTGECPQTKVSDRPLISREKSKRIVDWIVDPAAPGSAPSLTESTY